MPIKTYKPTSAGNRFKTVVDYSQLDKVKPLKKKTKYLKRKAGRSHGTITVRHQGAGNKRLYRQIDFTRRQKSGIPATVMSIEYDPNRTCFIARIRYQNGEQNYILAPQDLKKGDTVMSGEQASIKIGNALPLEKIPEGSVIHNIELTAGRGGQIVRSAGQEALLMAKEKKFAQIKLPSGEIRLFPLNCYATIGSLSNPDRKLIKWGKAGRKRHLGVRPSVRGIAMPAGVHPHGGGEGKTGTGRPPRTIYGKPAYGKTRRNKRSNKLIVRRRKQKR